MKISSFSSFGIVSGLPQLAFRVDALHFPLLTLFAEGTLFHCVLSAGEAAVWKRDSEVETNNPLAQKKEHQDATLSAAGISQLSLSCCSIHPSVQQSVTTCQEPATGLGTSKSPVPPVQKLMSVAGVTDA